MENVLHGQSSGLDIAAVLKGVPLLYQRGSDSWKDRIQTLIPPWQPLLFLSRAVSKTHQRFDDFSTSSNIQKMTLFHQEAPEKAQASYEKMGHAVHEAKASFLQKHLNQQQCFKHLKNAICLAEECFVTWGLIGKDMAQHISFLKKEGAVAVKPTGSGGDGYVLSLWDKQPPSHLQEQLIPAF